MNHRGYASILLSEVLGSKTCTAPLTAVLGNPGSGGKRRRSRAPDYLDEKGASARNGDRVGPCVGGGHRVVEPNSGIRRSAWAETPGLISRATATGCAVRDNGVGGVSATRRTGDVVHRDWSDPGVGALEAHGAIRDTLI